MEYLHENYCKCKSTYAVNRCMNGSSTVTHLRSAFCERNRFCHVRGSLPEQSTTDCVSIEFECMRKSGWTDANNRYEIRILCVYTHRERSDSRINRHHVFVSFRFQFQFIATRRDIPAFPCQNNELHLLGLALLHNWRRKRRRAQSSREMKQHVGTKLPWTLPTSAIFSWKIHHFRIPTFKKHQYLFDSQRFAHLSAFEMQTECSADIACPKLCVPCKR